MRLVADIHVPVYYFFIFIVYGPGFFGILFSPCTLVSLSIDKCPLYERSRSSDSSRQCPDGIEDFESIEYQQRIKLSIVLVIIAGSYRIRAGYNAANVPVFLLHAFFLNAHVA